MNTSANRSTGGSAFGSQHLGNLDHAPRDVWLAAAAAKVVERRHRPHMGKTMGVVSEPRAFIHVIGVRARVMIDRRIESDRYELDYKRTERHSRMMMMLLAAVWVGLGAE